MTQHTESSLLKHRLVIIFFGAIPATGWAWYLVQAGGFKPFWVVVCWAAAAAFWIAALASNKIRRLPVYRWSVLLTLSLGVFFATVPLVLNVRAWLLHFDRMSLDHHLMVAGILVLLLSPVGAAAYCFRWLRRESGAS